MLPLLSSLRHFIFTIGISTGERPWGEHCVCLNKGSDHKGPNLVTLLLCFPSKMSTGCRGVINYVKRIKSDKALTISTLLICPSFIKNIENKKLKNQKARGPTTHPKWSRIWVKRAPFIFMNDTHSGQKQSIRWLTDFPLWWLESVTTALQNFQPTSPHCSKWPQNTTTKNKYVKGR